MMSFFQASQLRCKVHSFQLFPSGSIRFICTGRFGQCDVEESAEVGICHQTGRGIVIGDRAFDPAISTGGCNEEESSPEGFCEFEESPIVSSSWLRYWNILIFYCFTASRCNDIFCFHCVWYLR